MFATLTNSFLRQEQEVLAQILPKLIIFQSRRPMSMKFFFKLIFKKNAPLIGQFFLKNDETMDEDQVELTGLAV